MDRSVAVHAAQGSRRPEECQLAGGGRGGREPAFEEHSTRERTGRRAGGGQPEWRSGAPRTGLSLAAGRSRLGRGQQCEVPEKRQGGGQTLLSQSRNRQLHEFNAGRKSELV